MGNTTPAYPRDYRVDRSKENFRLSVVEDFLKIINMPRSSLTDAMFNLLDSKDEGNISFGEYVEVICQFSCFEKQDLLKYFFYILDPHRTGVIEKNEIKHFITTIWENDLSSNVKEGMEYFDKLDDGDGCYTFPEIVDASMRYPNTFYPLYRLQVHIVRNTLGDFRWSFHKARLFDIKQEEKARERERQTNKIKQEAQAINEENDDLVMKRMGFFRFYFMPCLRQAERDRIKKIAAIEIELEMDSEMKKKI